MNRKTQIPYLYYLRVIAMLMVLMLHAITPYITNPENYASNSWYVFLILNAVSRGGVPLFFMISGFLMLSDDQTVNITAFYRKRLPVILVPLLVWNILYYIFYCMLDKTAFNPLTLFEQLIDCGTAYHLWYLYTLLAVYLLAPFLKRIADSCTIKQLVWLEVLVCFCGTIRPFINTVIPVYIYLFDPLFNGYIGFFLLGYILGKSEVSKKQLTVFLFLGAAGIILSAAGNHIASSHDSIDLLFNSGYNICYFLIASAVFCAFKKIHFKRELPLRIIKLLSKATFGVYIIHAAVMEIIMRYFMINASPVISSIYLFLIMGFFSFLFSCAAEKIKSI